MVQREIDEKTSDVVPNLQTPPPHIVLGGSSHLLVITQAISGLYPTNIPLEKADMSETNLGLG